MRTIKRNFDKYMAENPGSSTYTAFSAVIGGQGYSNSTVRRWFVDLVDKEDYEYTGKKVILSYLYSHAKPPEDDHNRGKKDTERRSKVEKV